MASVSSPRQMLCQADASLLSSRRLSHAHATCPRVVGRHLQAASPFPAWKAPRTARNVKARGLAVSGAVNGSSKTSNGHGTSKSSSPTVGDIMTSGRVFTVGPDTAVDEALEIICSQRVSGLPVVDGDNFVVGIVSDYDLLNLDGVLEEEERAQGKSMFPEVGKSWSTFKDIRTLLAKTGGKYVREVMTHNPYTIKADVSMDEASRMLMTKRIRRLPVVDDDGKLVGVLSRGNIVRAVLQHHLANKALLN